MQVATYWRNLLPQSSGQVDECGGSFFEILASVYLIARNNIPEDGEDELMIL
jgi:hypothetical protein